MPTFSVTTSTGRMPRGDVVELVCAYAREQLSPARAAHVERVAQLSAELCRRFGVDVQRGLLAACGHDIAREWPHERLMSEAARCGEPVSPFERNHPVLLHGRVAALILRDRFNVTDPAVLNAVRHHTLGHPQMGQLEKLLFVADYFEPGRGFLTPQSRAAVEGDDLDQMVLAAIADVRRRGLSVAQPTAVLEAQLQRRVTG